MCGHCCHKTGHRPDIIIVSRSRRGSTDLLDGNNLLYTLPGKHVFMQIKLSDDFLLVVRVQVCLMPANLVCDGSILFDVKQISSGHKILFSRSTLTSSPSV